MADNLDILSDSEIRLECLRLAVEFSPENIRINPLEKAQLYFDWVQNKNSARQSKKTSLNKDKL